LHATEIWAPSGAIAGYANASSNGLPEEERLASGLIEVGVHLKDKDKLKAIERWFDSLYW
jgi:hypothetical protein